MFYCYTIAGLSASDRYEETGSAREEEVKNMEDLDIPAGLTSERVGAELARRGGRLWGIWNGGTFGLWSNRILVISAWPESDPQEGGAQIDSMCRSLNLQPIEKRWLRPTTRPSSYSRLPHSDGLVVFRWLKMPARNVEPYLDLTLPSWKFFEAQHNVDVVGLFSEIDGRA